MALTKFEPLPPRYKHLINEDQYIRLLEIAQDFLEQYGKVSKIEDGLIDFTSFEGSDQRFGLDNLIRNLLDEAPAVWPSTINEHFSKFFSNVELGFDLGNFEQIKDIISIRVYPDSYFDSITSIGELIFKIDFEDTMSTLVFDYPDKFEPVFREHFSKWNVSEETAFQIAMEHLNQHEVQVGKKEFDNGFNQYSFFSSTYSPCILLDFERNAKIAKGKFGSLVNIPTHGSAFAVPINRSNVPEIIVAITDTINKFYDEDPGPITTNYYWYYSRKFTKFQTSKTKDGLINLHLPPELIELLKNS
ncbi:hypothetical protein BH10BAC4_BH10BAC4_09210 [soil metagenome]